MRFLLGETNEFGCSTRDFVRIEREQNFSGPVLEGRNDLGHGVEHAERHGPGHGGDEGVRRCLVDAFDEVGHEAGDVGEFIEVDPSHVIGGFVVVGSLAAAEELERLPGF